MKMKLLQEVKTKEVKEIRDAVTKAREELLQLQLDHSQFKLKSPRSLANKKREIAVLLTVQREKEAYGKNS